MGEYETQLNNNVISTKWTKNEVNKIIIHTYGLYSRFLKEVIDGNFSSQVNSEKGTWSGNKGEQAWIVLSPEYPNVV